jgi:hypothetical protein
MLGCDGFAMQKMYGENVSKELTCWNRWQVFLGKRIRLISYCCIEDSLDRSWNMAQFVLRIWQRHIYCGWKVFSVGNWGLHWVWWDLHRIIAWVFLVAYHHWRKDSHTWTSDTFLLVSIGTTLRGRGLECWECWERWKWVAASRDMSYQHSLEPLW